MWVVDWLGAERTAVDQHHRQLCLRTRKAEPQSFFAGRINVTPSWLSRYLDLARLPAELMAAFGDPHELGIKHVTMIKPLLKPADRRQRVFAEAERIARARDAGERVPGTAIDTIRRLAIAADSPNRSGSPKKSGSEVSTIQARSGKPLLKVGKGRGGLTLLLPARSGASREEMDTALASVLDQHWS